MRSPISSRARASRASSWVCLLLEGVASICLSGFVLCLGDDGHLALEPMFAESCCAGEQHAPAASIAAGEPCGCTDTSLSQPAIGAQVRDASAPRASGAWSSTAGMSAHTGRLRRDRSLVLGAAIPEPVPLRSRRSIVLLA